MPRIIENKLFFDSSRWQRFIHCIYINDMINNLFTNNYEETVCKAIKYAYLSKNTVETNVTSVIDTLLQKSDYLEYFKSNINKLKSLQVQNSETIETTLAEFDAPLLHSRLKLWSPIFQKWKDIYSNPKSDVYNIVYNSIQTILNQDKKTISTFALNLGLKNPNAEMYKQLTNSLQCKHSDNIRILLKQIIFEEITFRYPYKRGNGKFLFLTDKAIKQYSDNWNVSYLSSFNVRKSLYEPLVNVLQNTGHSQLTTDNEFIVKNEDSVTTNFRNICLSQSRKRKMSDLLLKIDSSSHKRRKLHCSTESLTAIISETSEKEPGSFDNNDLSDLASYREDQSNINSNSDIRHIFSEVKTAKTIINDLSEERKNMLIQIKELKNQKNLWNEDTKQLLELEKMRILIDELTTDRDSKIEEIKKLEEELQYQETLKVYEELRLRSEIESVKKINSELINKQGRMFVKINVLQKELEKIKEGVKKVHQEKTEKSE